MIPSLLKKTLTTSDSGEERLLAVQDTFLFVKGSVHSPPPTRIPQLRYGGRGPRFLLSEASRREASRDVRLVRRFVMRETRVSVDTIEAGARRGFYFGSNLRELYGKCLDEFFHWFLYAFLVLFLVRLEPVAVIVAFQTPEEAQSCFRKGWEIWADHPSIVDIRRIAV